MTQSRQGLVQVSCGGLRRPDAPRRSGLFRGDARTPGQVRRRRNARDRGSAPGCQSGADTEIPRPLVEDVW